VDEEESNGNYEIVPVNKKDIAKQSEARERVAREHRSFLVESDTLANRIFESAERIYQNNPDLKSVSVGKMTISEEVEPLRAGFFYRKTEYLTKRKVELPEIRMERKDREKE
jgi:hypothetical protein